LQVITKESLLSAQVKRKKKISYLYFAKKILFIILIFWIGAH